MFALQNTPMIYSKDEKREMAAALRSRLLHAWRLFMLPVFNPSVFGGCPAFPSILMPLVDKQMARSRQPFGIDAILRGNSNRFY
jgi:hypothetical protein